MQTELLIKNKTCNKCKAIYPRTNNYFYSAKSASKYLSSICKSCDNKRNKLWKKNNRDKYDDWVIQSMSKEVNYVRQSFQRPFKASSINPKPRANGWQRVGWQPEITLEELYAELILHIQSMKDKFPTSDGRLCRYCEEPWTYSRTSGRTTRRNNKNFSLDRFDTTQTYKKGNVIFCCSKCNITKTDSTKKDWLKYLEIDKELNESKTD